MLYPFCKYEDETEVSFSDIKINDKMKNVYIFTLKDQQKMVLIALDLNFLVIK